MSDKDLRSQLEGLFSDIALEPDDVIELRPVISGGTA